MTADECLEFQTLVRNKIAVNFTDSGKFTNKKWADSTLAYKFYERLLELDPQPRYLKPGDLIKSGLYLSTDNFGLHTDTGQHYDRVTKTKSRWTLIIYLNTVDSGGETIFYSPDTWKEVLRVKPEAGKALLFDIDLWHRAAPITAGEKLWIGCEIIGAMTSKIESGAATSNA